MTTQAKTNQEKFDEVIFNERGVKVLFDGRVRIDDEIAKFELIEGDDRFKHVYDSQKDDMKIFKVKGSDYFLEVCYDGEFGSHEEVNGTDADLETILEQYN